MQKRGGNCWSNAFHRAERDGISTKEVGLTGDFKPIIHSNRRKNRLTIGIEIQGKTSGSPPLNDCIFLPLI